MRIVRKRPIIVMGTLKRSMLRMQTCKGEAHTFRSSFRKSEGSARCQFVNLSTCHPFSLANLPRKRAKNIIPTNLRPNPPPSAVQREDSPQPRFGLFPIRRSAFRFVPLPLRKSGQNHKFAHVGLRPYERFINQGGGSRFANSI